LTLTRDQILAKRAELARQAVDVPELGGEVMIRTLTLKEVREIQKAQQATKEPLAIYPRVVAMGCVDESGQQLFVGEDIKLIDDLPWAATDAIAKAVLRFNKMTGEEEENENGNGNGVPKE
jgi:hypothetical protein